MATDSKNRGFTSAMSASLESATGVVLAEKPFGQALARVAKQRPEILALTADLGKYTDLDVFASEFPNRFIQVGMAEQNLVGVAAGLARIGYIPFATTYCVFATRRAYDFIAIDAAYGRANVKIIAGLPGLTTGYGATHQGIDDLALMRAVPNLVVIDPCDATEISQAVEAIAAYDGPVYMRILRGRVPVTLDPKTYKFEIGKAQLLRQGKDLCLISTGLMTSRALTAADRLASEGLAAALLHVPTLKPLDKEAVLEAVPRGGRVLTLENHSTIGGLGSAVADVICEAGIQAKLIKLGVPDCFVECGTVDYLVEKYGLSIEDIARAAKQITT